MRRYIPALLLALAAIAPFPLAGCDMLAKLKGGSADAGLEAAAVEVDAAPPAPEADAAPAPTALPTAVPTTPSTTVRPVVVADAGAKTDAAAPIVDAGAPKTDSGVAPVPTPNLKIPANLFDGGLIRLDKIDAGGFKPPWQR